MNRRLWIWLVLAAATAGVAVANPVPSEVVINEVVYDSPGTDVDTWLELKGTPGMSLDGYEVVGVNGNGGTEYQTIDLTGQVIPADGYFVIAENPAFPEADMVDSNVDYQNSPDNIVLKFDGVVVDALGYGEFTGGDVFAGEGSPAPDQLPPNSLARCPDGSDTGDNSLDFRLDDTPTPGAENDAYCPQGLGACCLPSGECVVVEDSECFDLGGEYLGDNTVCDPYPCPAMPVGLCDAAEVNADGVPLLEGRLIQVEGVAIAPSGIWSTTAQDFQITDGDCCVAVFGGPIDPFIQIGDEVRVTGTVENYNGRLEITNPGLVVEVLSSGNPIPDPTFISTFELSMNGEDYESCFIGLSCVSIVGGPDPWPAEGSNANVTVDDGSGPVIMRIDRDTNIDGSPEPMGPFNVIGIGWQFDSTFPYTDGYQILPRSLDDLTPCGAQPGACCFEDGSCQILASDECAAQGGAFEGEGTVCEPNPCPQPPTGACCLDQGGCVVLTEAECTAQGGGWLGEGIPCDPDPCGPPPEGACCFATGECVVLMQAECEAELGVYQGDGTGCDPNPCPPPVPTKTTTWGQIKDQHR